MKKILYIFLGLLLVSIFVSAIEVQPSNNPDVSNSDFACIGAIASLSAKLENVVTKDYLDEDSNRMDQSNRKAINSLVGSNLIILLANDILIVALFLVAKAKGLI